MAPNLRRAASQAAASQSQTAEAESALPELRGLRDPKNLWELANLNLMNKNFHIWKHLMMTEFDYYSIDKIIDDSHLSSTTGDDQRHWIEIEQLFNCHLIIHTPPALYQLIFQKGSLREKWLVILQRNSSSDLFKNTWDLLTIKYDIKDTVDSFIIKLQNVWNELKNHDQTVTNVN